MQPGASYGLAGALRWFELDGDWVVYNTVTGALRCADAPTAAVLAMLEDGPASAAMIAQHLSAATETMLGEGVRVGISELLADLQRTGFVDVETR